jgi:non-ribosomal peptide synthetase-like protein
MSNERPPRLLHEVFARAADRHAAAPALDLPPGEGRALREMRSYAALDAEARRVAAALGPDRGERIVAILLGRDTPWLCAAQLGVLRAGAAYLGLEPRFPDEHLRSIVADAGARTVLSDAGGCARLRPLLGPGIELLAVEDLPDGSDAPVPFDGDDRRLAYLIYTSGSSGRPKGVMIEHRSIVRLVLGDLAAFGLGPGDRVAQGSSPAYDSSVEETWLALAAGATLVPMDDEVVRRGPDLLAWLRAERISVLCPPPTLLRTTGCEDPSAALPDLRLLYVGGEALPQDLADRWARRCRMVNGYGPTECTVTVTRAEVVPGEAVTIGDAVPGSTALVLDEELREVPDGSFGELCIAGLSLARGYLGRPELDAEKFVVHPVHGRIYRSGDRVRRGPRGALEYAGRLDAQVKLRGHRVELAEIEARLAAGDGVRAAACAVEDGDRLAAFLVPGDPLRPPDLAALVARLRAEVPEHMVPTRFAILDALPTSVGGKLDRRALPRVGAEPVAAAAGRAPDGPLEELVAAAVADALGRAAVPADRDFFDLGGDSVRAALCVSRLRADPRTRGLAVRDVYEGRTVAALAARAAASIEADLPAIEPGPGPQTVSTATLRWVSAAQALWLLAELAAGTGLGYLAVFVVLPELLAGIDPLVLLLVGPLGAPFLRLALALPALALAVATKRALIGRYRPGRHPAYGGFHLRHWIVQRCVRLLPFGLVQGTELQLAALRALGARIGRGVHIHRGVDLLAGGWDLLEIGDRAALGQDAALGLCELDAGQLVFGPVRIGPDAVLEVRAGVDGGAALGPGACLGALSRIEAGTEVPAGERWDGIPARSVGPVAAAPEPENGGRALGPVAHTCLTLGLRAAATWIGLLPLVALTGLLLIAAGADAAAVRAWLDDPEASPAGLGLALLALCASAPLGLLASAFALRLGPRIPAGVLRSRSALHVLAQARALVLDRAGVWLSGTLFWPAWLRLAGASIGRRVEVSTIVDVLPEQLRIGDDCFLADGIYLGGPRIDRGTVAVGPVAVGSRSFLGNHVVVPPSTALPEDLLLGVCTVADPGTVTAGSSWFGHPPFRLPRREVVEVDRSLTFEPGPLRFANRVFWEALRFAIPVVPALAALAWLDAVAPAAGPVRPLLATFAVAAGLCLLVLGLKWALLGRVRPGHHGLWSCWCSRWDFLYVAWGMLARDTLARLGGTLWLGFYLRAMGVQIGRRVVLGPGFAQVVDPDMLSFGDGATVDTMFQAHSFEDRVLKIDRVRIGAGATLRRASVVLYGAEIGAGAEVGAHSVVMKNERLAPGQRYVGVPTRPVGP